MQEAEQYRACNLLKSNPAFKRHLLQSELGSIVRDYGWRFTDDEFLPDDSLSQEKTHRLLRMVYELDTDLWLLNSISSYPLPELKELYEQEVKGVLRHIKSMAQKIAYGYGCADPTHVDMEPEELLSNAMRSHAAFQRKFETLQSDEFFHNCTAWRDIKCETFAIEKILPRITELNALIEHAIQEMGYMPPEEVSTSFAKRLEESGTKKVAIVDPKVSAARAQGKNVVSLFPKGEDKPRG